MQVSVLFHPFMATPCPLSPTVSLDQLWKILGDIYASERTFRALQQDTEFAKAELRAHQIFDITTWARAEFGINITIGSLVLAFHCSRCAVRSALANGFDQLESRRRHVAFSRT
jgi:hypothetical protein